LGLSGRSLMSGARADFPWDSTRHRQRTARQADRHRL